MAFPIRGTGFPVLLALTIGVVEAQPARPTATAASAPATASSAARGPAYQSAFEGYRSYSELPLTPWRQANDVVRSVGGWQAYARESQAEPSSGAGDRAPMPPGHAGMDMRPSPSASVPRPAATAASGTRPIGATQQNKP